MAILTALVATLLPTVVDPPVASAATGDLSVVAGAGPNGFLGECLDDPLDAEIQNPDAIDVAPSGAVAASTPETHRVIGLVGGTVTNLAGTSAAGPANAVDGGPAVTTAINDPAGVAYDSAGNLFVVEQGRHRVRRIAVSTGIITTVAGSDNGVAGSTGDGGAATSARLTSPSAIAVDGTGALFIVDASSRVRRVDAVTGVITTIVSGLTNVRGIAVSPDGNDVFLSVGHQIQLYDTAAATLDVVAGQPAPGSGGDGGKAVSASLNLPLGLDLDSAGHLFVADSDNHRVRRIDAFDNVITTVAGTGVAGFSEGNGPATDYMMDRPTDVAFSSGGILHIADADNRRLRSIQSGRLVTIAGSGGGVDAGEYGICATKESTLFNGPTGVEVDPAGNIYVADETNKRVRRIDVVTGEVSTVAGNGTALVSGDGGPATEAGLSGPVDVALDDAGNLYIADSAARRVRRVAAGTGIITTVAGTGGLTFTGDGGPATAAAIGPVNSIDIDPQGRLLLTTGPQGRIRRVALDGTITTVAGDGNTGFSGDGGPATSAAIGTPTHVAVDNDGDIYLVQGGATDRVRRVDGATGIITTVAGTGTPGFSGDGGPANAAQFSGIGALAFDTAGSLYIADEGNGRIRRVDATTGVVTTVAGNGAGGSDGDEGPATSVGIGISKGIAVSETGDLIIATDDAENHRVRRVEGDVPVGFLRATTTPAVPATITVDGIPRDAWGLTWLELPTGAHEVCFGAVGGFTPPPCQNIVINPGQTTVADGAYSQRGFLRVTTTPAVPATIVVDGIPRNDWGLWTEVDPGSYNVCFDKVADFTPPPCQNVVVTAGNTVVADGIYTSSPGADGASGHGYLRATTSPATGSRITIDGEFADSWGLTWLKLAPDIYDVCYEDVLYATAPVCEEVKIFEGQTEVIDGAFTPHGFLQVSTSPAVPAVIYIDGQRANAWGAYTSLEPGPHTVCYGALPGPGLAPPPCQVVNVTAGVTTPVVGTYT